MFFYRLVSVLLFGNQCAPETTKPMVTPAKQNVVVNLLDVMGNAPVNHRRHLLVPVHQSLILFAVQMGILIKMPVSLIVQVTLLNVKENVLVLHLPVFVQWSTILFVV